MQSLYNMLGEAHYRLNEFAEAERWYKAALQAKPDHVPAHLTYGKMLAKNVSINHIICSLHAIFSNQNSFLYQTLKLPLMAIFIIRNL